MYNCITYSSIPAHTHNIPSSTAHIIPILAIAPPHTILPTCPYLTYRTANPPNDSPTHHYHVQPMAQLSITYTCACTPHNLNKLLTTSCNCIPTHAFHMYNCLPNHTCYYTQYSNMHETHTTVSHIHNPSCHITHTLQHERYLSVF